MKRFFLSAGLFVGLLASSQAADQVQQPPRQHTDRSTAQRPAPASQPDSGGAASVDIRNLTGGGAKASGNETLIERVVTGIGTDPDKALQAAFSQAIESTVGVLVDAETIIRNDQIIKDQILTFSRGFVQKFEVVKQWQADGLHHATIKALVETGKLTEKLKANNIATHEVPGELIARQISFDAKNEEQVAEMFKKALVAFDMTKLTKVEIVGKPEITRDGANARVHITVRVSPDLGQWNSFSQDLRLILRKAATRRAAVSMQHGESDVGRDIILPSGGPDGYAANQLRHQLDAQGVLLALFNNVSGSGKKTQWEVLRVPEPMGEVVEAIAGRIHYQLVYLLLGEHGEEIVRTSQPLGPSGVYQDVTYPLDQTWWIGPVCLRRESAVLETATTVVLFQEDFAKVAKTSVFLEEDTQGRR